VSWWRRRPAQATVEHSWSEPVNSSDPDVPFIARLHLTMRADGSGPPDQGSPVLSAAATGLREEVEKVARRWSVLHRQSAQHELNDRLARIAPYSQDEPTVRAVTAILSVPQESAHAATRLLELRREAHLDELARRQVAANMRFLRDVCFDNPASARLFLMLNASPRLGVFPTTDEAEDLVTEVGRWHPENLWVQVAKTLHAALGSVSADQAAEMLRVLAALLRATGHPIQADQLLRLREDLPHTDAAPPAG
jgi:hypothetical protein